MPRFLRAPGVGGAPWILFALVYLYAFPYFDALRSANELPRVLMTQEIVDKGHFHIEGRLADMGSTMDTSQAPNGHLYPNKAPGPSFVAVPVYLVLKLFGVKSLAACTWAFRVFTVTFPSLLFLFFFHRATAVFTPKEESQRTALVAYGLGSPALPYALLFMSHQLAAAAAGGSFVAAIRLARDPELRRPWLAGLLVGFLAALGVMMDYQTILASTLVGLYVLVRGPHRLRNLAAMALGAAPVAVALGAYHKVCFGGVLTTGYTFAADTVTRRGFLGLVGPSWDSFRAVLFEPSNGLFVLAPWVVFAIVGAVALLARREARRRAAVEAITCLLVFVSFVVFLGCLYPTYARAGWCIGPRYMTAALPFVAWLAAAGFAEVERWAVGRVVAWGLVFAAVVVFVTGATTFPHWPEGVKNPVHELVFPLLRGGYAVHSLGSWVGLRGLASLLPLYGLVLMLTGALLTMRYRRYLVSAAAALALGLVIVAGHAAFPRTGPYADRALGFAKGIWEPAPTKVGAKPR